MPRKKPKAVKLKVAKIHDVWNLGDYWWARVDATGPLGTYSVNTEAEARGCVGVSFNKDTLIKTPPNL